MSRSNGDRRAALQRGLAIAFAVLGGAATYVLIISTSHHDAGRVAAAPLPAQSGVINMSTPQAPQATQVPASQARPPSPVPPLLPVGPGFDGPVAGGGPIALEPNSGGPGRPIDLPPVIAGDQPLGPPLQPAPPQAPVPEPPPQAAVVFVPTCWGVKTPVVAVGEPGEIELNIRSCQTGPLPASIFAALASESADVSVAGPIDGTKEEAAQSWTWTVTATTAGRHDSSSRFIPRACSRTRSRRRSS